MWPKRPHYHSHTDAEYLAMCERDVARNPQLEADALAAAEERHAANLLAIKSHFAARLKHAIENRDFYASRVKAA